MSGQPPYVVGPPGLPTDDEAERIAGVTTAAELQDAYEAARLCRFGYHAWVPWLQLPNTSYVTWCARRGCAAQEQYDL